MSWGDFQALLPLAVIGYGAVMLLTIGAFWRNHAGMSVLTLVTLAASFLTVFAALPLAPRQITPLLRVDSLALFYIALFALGGFAIVIFAHDYLGRRSVGSEKFYVLLLLAVLGMGILASSVHFASFFLGIETLSVSLYGLVGYTLGRKASLEGSVKYLVLAGVSVSFLLLGMALVYFELGTMEFDRIADVVGGSSRHHTPVVLLGIALMLVGFGFKLAFVPFHTWAPDVYQGAPSPITALIATGSKAGVFALMLRFLFLLHPRQLPSLFLVLSMLAVITMFGGNLLALLQRNLKRLLAYSSVAHMGYLLIPLLAGGAHGASSFGFYFVSYFITTIGAFGVISMLSTPEDEAEDLDSYRGLGFSRPWLGAALALMMLSLAGIPPTIGFMAKFYIFAAAARSGLWLLLVVGVLNSGLAAYYYLRVLVTLYLQPPGETAWRAAPPASSVVLGVLTVLLVCLGIYPTPLIWLVERSAKLWLGGP